MQMGHWHRGLGIGIHPPLPRIVSRIGHRLYFLTPYTWNLGLSTSISGSYPISWNIEFLAEGDKVFMNPVKLDRLVKVDELPAIGAGAKAAKMAPNRKKEILLCAKSLI